MSRSTRIRRIAGQHQVAVLATHYLSEAGVVERRPDVVWEGRVWVPSDAERAVSALAAAEPAVASRAKTYCSSSIASVRSTTKRIGGRVISRRHLMRYKTCCWSSRAVMCWVLRAGYTHGISTYGQPMSRTGGK